LSDAEHDLVNIIFTSPAFLVQKAIFAGRGASNLEGVKYFDLLFATNPTDPCLSKNGAIIAILLAYERVI